MRLLLKSINKITSINKVAVFGLRYISSTTIVVPVLVSLFLTIFSQAVRILYNYPVIPVLFVIPVLVLLLLMLVHVITRINYYPSGSTDDVSGLSIKVSVFITACITTLIIARFIGIVWGSKYLSPLYEAQYVSGHAHIDTLFHSAIANMLQYFGQSSIGVEGVVAFPYHFGSHLLMAGVSRLLHLSVLQSYHLVYPTLVLPLWLGSFLLLSEVIRQKWFPSIERRWLTIVALLIFFFSISGIMPEKFRDSVGAWNNIIISESYACAIMFLYLLISFLIKYYPERSSSSISLSAIAWYASVLLGATVLTSIKVSVGTLWCVGLTFLWLSNPSKVHLLFSAIIAGVGWLGVLPFIQSSTGMSGSYPWVILF